jgi:hypothetical protein
MEVRVPEKTHGREERRIVMQIYGVILLLQVYGNGLPTDAVNEKEGGSDPAAADNPETAV